MSYCGTCGGFYSSDCPRRQGADPGATAVCMPAPNPFEERTAKLYALAVASSAAVAGCTAANLSCRAAGAPDKYSEEDFRQIAADLLSEIAIIEAG